MKCKLGRWGVYFPRSFAPRPLPLLLAIPLSLLNTKTARQRGQFHGLIIYPLLLSVSGIPPSDLSLALLADRKQTRGRQAKRSSTLFPI